jgi:hypothetical protein
MSPPRLTPLTFQFCHKVFLEKGIFIPVSARVLHTTNSYYKSSLLLFLSSQKAKPNKGKID